MALRFVLWVAFIINSVGIGAYLIATSLKYITAPKNILYILLTYGIFTTFVFGDVVLKPLKGGKNKGI